MTSLIIAGIVIVLVVTLLIKGFYPQAALFIGGLALLGATAAFDFGEVLSADKSTNFAAFDVFKAFCTGFSSRIAGLGLTLMAIGGFSRYMEYVGASGALFSVFERPLSKIKSPYVLLAAAFLASQCLVVFIPSHAGLALLLMVMLYPILIRSRRDRLLPVHGRWPGRREFNPRGTDCRHGRIRILCLLPDAALARHGRHHDIRRGFRSALLGPL